jgi:hypothetical protein
VDTTVTKSLTTDILQAQERQEEGGGGGNRGDSALPMLFWCFTNAILVLYQCYSGALPMLN